MDELRHDYPLILCRLGEVWLKGRNRGVFLERLRRNLHASLGARLEGVKVQKTHGRFFVKLADPAQLADALPIILDTPGLSGASPCIRIEGGLEEIQAAALELAQSEWSGLEGSFAVDSRRTWKQFPLPSPEINRVVGGPIQEALGFSVNLKRPDRRLGIEVNEDHHHLWAHTFHGVGGLPIGSAGRVMLLLSGGIDSPVAGYLAQKRGCELDAVYFHSPPFVSEASRDKVETLARSLAPRQSGLRLHVVHFTEIQKAIKEHCDRRMTVLLYRRFMYRIAARLAAQRRCQALATGENLGQVASQTLENLTVVDGLDPILTLRPLITFDKQEIMALARGIDTYDVSILPHDDCCTLFVPRNPTLRGSNRELEAQEERLEVEALIEEAIEATEVVRL